MKKALTTVFLTLVTLCAMAPMALAQAGGEAADNEFTMKGLIGFGAALGLAIAAAGGAIGQSRAASAALEGIARNPGAADKLFTPFILSLALIESLVIYMLVLAFVVTG